MRHPDDTMPPFNRVHSITSCGACLRIASRRGFEIGATTDEGVIEAFTHEHGFVQAAIVGPGGEVVKLYLDTLEHRRSHDWRPSE